MVLSIAKSASLFLYLFQVSGKTFSPEFLIEDHGMTPITCNNSEADSVEDFVDIASLFGSSIDLIFRLVAFIFCSSIISSS